MAEKSTESALGPRPRAWLAPTVLVLAMAGITALAIAVIVADEGNAPNVFNVLIPVIASWVGTVLAFHFGRESHESASREVRQLVRDLTPTERANEPVTSVMRLAANTIILTLTEETTADSISLARVKERFVGQASRLPVLTADRAPQYMIHESSVDQYLAASGTPTTTLADFVADRASEPKPVRFDPDHGFLTVGPTATLSQVSEEMEQINSVQDIFVTADGSSNSELLGWVSNIRLGRYLRG